ncbi:hypothetical protein GDO81_005671 [Engystomops pustulosus]|uniref:Uncharacterized protein n=1 Tax=Engystomops pustulosus TaxID=76066 RepID=A0AAV7CTN6_ENGPU|nr:hypothetical protein GDO81_005671 [Engystomops pustulosus]
MELFKGVFPIYGITTATSIQTVLDYPAEMRWQIMPLDKLCIILTAQAHTTKLVSHNGKNNSFFTHILKFSTSKICTTHYICQFLLGSTNYQTILQETQYVKAAVKTFQQ